MTSTKEHLKHTCKVSLSSVWQTKPGSWSFWQS